jgi:hypothetical protein
MLEDAIADKNPAKREASSDDEYPPQTTYSNTSFPPERKRRRSDQKRRHSHDKSLPPIAALVAPKLQTTPEIPFDKFVPRPCLLTPPESARESESESALGVLAQVAHELETPEDKLAGNYFADANVLPADLADSLVQL